MKHTVCIHIWLITHTNFSLIESHLISNIRSAGIYSSTTLILQLWWVIQPEILDVWVNPSLVIIRHISRERIITNHPISVSLFFLKYICPVRLAWRDIICPCIPHPDATLGIYFFYPTNHEILSALRIVYNISYIVDLVYNDWFIHEKNMVKIPQHVLPNPSLTIEISHCSSLPLKLSFFTVLFLYSP